jgi:hypothetical protein
MIEYNLVDGAGTLGDASNTLCGIWPGNHQDGIIQYNEVRGTHATGDAMAFDNDCCLKGVTKFQYNYSHDNQNGFFEEYGPLFVDNSSHTIPDYDKNAHSIIRYNISRNDGGDVVAGIIPSFFTTSRSNALINNNVFYNTNINTIGISIWEMPGYGSVSNLYDTIENNIFYVNNLSSNNNGGLICHNNCYFGGAIPFSNETYPTPITSDPQFYDPMLALTGSNDNGMSAAYAFKLNPGSQCINAGTSISNNGGVDFWGTRLYVNNPDIGADEYFGLTGDGTLATIPSTGQVICFARGTDNSVHYRIQNTPGANNSYPLAWNALGGAAYGSIAAIKGYGNDLYIFSKTSGNVLQYNRLPYGSSSWDGWKQLSGITVGSKIAVAADPNNYIVICLCT